MVLEEEIYSLMGCRNLIVETDAKYLYGMLDNPGRLPNATTNRWVEFIRTHFRFTLVHKQGKTFGPDGLSRRKPYPGDVSSRRFNDGSDVEEEDLVLIKSNPEDQDPLKLEEFYDEIDTRTGYIQKISNYQGIARSIQDFTKELNDAKILLHRENQEKERIINNPACPKEQKTFLAYSLQEKLIPDLENKTLEELEEEYEEEHRSETAKLQDDRLPKIKEWLRQGARYDTTSNTDPNHLKFLRAASHFFLDKDGRLYRKNKGGNQQLVVDKAHRHYMMEVAHDCLGHRGIYATTKLIGQRFWWPDFESDVTWYVRSCHICQVRQKMAMELPPVVTHTPSIFQILHADMVHISPSSNGCKYLVNGRCALSLWVEAKALRKEDARSIGSWLFEDVICRWGCLVKIVTDNSSPFRKAVKWIEEKYSIRGVAISPYNSQAN
jgi:hypothetical protein